MLVWGLGASGWNGAWEGKGTFARSEPPTKPIATFLRRFERRLSISGVTA